MQYTPEGSSRFLTNVDQLKALNMAKSNWKMGMGTDSFEMEGNIGEGLLENGNEIIRTNKVFVKYDNMGNVITLYPKIEK